VNRGRFNALYGAATAAAALGKSDLAHEYYAQIVKNCADSKSDRAELKHAREEAGRLAHASARTVPEAFPSARTITATPKAVAVNLAGVKRLASS